MKFYSISYINSLLFDFLCISKFKLFAKKLYCTLILDPLKSLFLKCFNGI